MEQDASLEAGGKKEKGLTPKELFQKHLKDPEHHVTDEELRSLKVGADAESKASVERQADKKKEKTKSDSNNDTLPNPYEVLQ